MDDLIRILTPVAVALLVELLKRVAPKIPKRILPFLATVLGAASQALTGDSSVGDAVVTGAASVGAYELMDKAKPQSNAPTAMLLLFLFGLPGCTVLQKFASQPIYVTMAKNIASSSCYDLAGKMGKEELVATINTLEAIKANGPDWFAKHGVQYNKESYDMIWYAFHYAMRNLDDVHSDKMDIYVKLFAEVYDACISGMKKKI